MRTQCSPLVLWLLTIADTFQRMPSASVNLFSVSFRVNLKNDAGIIICSWRFSAECDNAVVISASKWLCCRDVCAYCVVARHDRNALPYVVLRCCMLPIADYLGARGITCAWESSRCLPPPLFRFFVASCLLSALCVLVDLMALSASFFLFSPLGQHAFTCDIGILGSCYYRTA